MREMFLSNFLMLSDPNLFQNAFDGENENKIYPMPLMTKLKDRQRYEFVSSRTLAINVL